MTNGQSTGSNSPMEDTGGVSGMMNLTINLPDNVRISTVDTDQEETSVSNGNTTGMIQIYAGSTAPDGWLLCNGAAVSRATYADLFAVIGTDYGLGNANTTFNLPDLRGRFPLGKDDMGGVSADRVTDAEADVLGSGGGAEKYALTTDQMPEHTHPTYYASGGPGSTYRSLRGSSTDDGNNHHLERWISTEDKSVVAPAGGNQAHDNMSPYQTLNYIIKT